MKAKALFFSFLVALSLVLALAGPVAAVSPVEPAEVVAEIAPGGSIKVNKTVHTPAYAPTPDIYFLADTTGSMGDAIANVIANSDTIMSEVIAVQPDAQFGVGNYKDFPYDAYCFQAQQAITDNTDAVASAISAWSASGGADGPEGQFYALTKIATDPAIGWRTGSNRIVVWFGDCPGHDPVPPAATGLADNITEATVTQALKDAGIRVIAISVGCDWLDADPSGWGGDYAYEYGITEGGSAGQASRIAAATGGVFLSGVSTSEVVDAILAGLGTLPITVTGVPGDCSEYLEITLDPASRTVTSGEDATFVETIMVSPDVAPGSDLECVVVFYGGDAIIGRELIKIHVKGEAPPVPSVTTWGMIATIAALAGIGSLVLLRKQTRVNA